MFEIEDERVVKFSELSMRKDVYFYIYCDYGIIYV